MQAPDWKKKKLICEFISRQNSFAEKSRTQGQSCTTYRTDPVKRKQRVMAHENVFFSSPLTNTFSSYCNFSL